MLKIDHKHCTGCGACVEACPQLAVVKIRDRYKFIYPSIDPQRCIGCGRCDEVCPLCRQTDNPSEGVPDGFQPLYYAAKAKDRGTLIGSHAGGLFFLLGKHVIARGGVVYGCVFDENFHPRHVRASTTTELVAMKGVKPVQSDTDGVFSSVRSDLEKGVTVLFAGTPCQCDGLRHFLGKRYDHLTVVDMLCGGVTSEGVFHRYLHWREQRLGGRIRDIRFENKRAFGYRSGTRIIFRRGRVHYLLSTPAPLDRLMRMQQSGAVLRRSCGSCPYTVPERVGDLSLGRFVHIRRAHPAFPFDGGVSLVVVSSPQGEALLDELANELYLEESDLCRASYNRRLVAPVRQSRFRKKRLDEIFTCDFDVAAEPFRVNGLLSRMIIWCCWLLPDRLVMAIHKMARTGSALWTRLTDAFRKKIRKKDAR